jgi:hypothetical protein
MIVSEEMKTNTGDQTRNTNNAESHYYVFAVLFVSVPQGVTCNDNGQHE